MNIDPIHCPNCAHLMVAKNDGVTRGMYCPHCGWNVVSTAQEDICFDTTTYTLSVDENQASTIESIRTLSSLTGASFLDSRSMLRNGGKVMVGDAVDVVKSARILANQNIKITISPHFKWQL